MAQRTPETSYQHLVLKLQQFRRRRTILSVTAGLLTLLTIGLGGTLALLLLETALYLTPATKLFLVGLLGAGLLALFVRFCALPLFVPPSLPQIALQVEAHHGGLQQQLISALQLWQNRMDAQHSSGLINAAVVQAAHALDNLDLHSLLDPRRPMRLAALCAGIGLLFATAFGFWPGPLQSAAARLTHPATTYVRPPDTHIELYPGHAKIIAGEPFEVHASLSGVVPSQARLLVREEGVEGWSSIELAVRKGGISHRFPAVSRAFEYSVQANDAQTRAYTLSVQPRPLITGITHNEHYPAYTGLPPRTQVEGGDVAVPAGTRISLSISASHPLSETWLAFEGGTRLSARVQNNTATIELTVSGDNRYVVGLKDTLGITNRDPVQYRMLALQDHPPEIRLLRPGRDIELGEGMQVALLAEAHDDFGVAHMEIRYRVNDQTDDQIQQIPLDTPGAREISQISVWDLSQLDLLPGDQIAYRVRVYDTNTLSGPGENETSAFTIRFPSLIEIHQQAQQEQEQSIEQLERMQEAGNDLQQRLEKVARELLKNNDLNWQEKKELETALKDQAQAGEQLQELAKSLDETLQRLEQSGLMSEESLQKMDEVRELLSRIETPALKKAMEQLQQAMQDVDPQAVEDALENFREQQEAFQQNLDRTIALLKEVQKQQTLDALVKSLNDLAEKQQNLAEAVRPEENLDGLAEREDALQRDAQQIQDELRRAAQQMDDPAAAELDNLAKELDNRNISERMEQISQDLRTAQQTPARNQAEQIAKDLQELSGQLQQTRQNFVQRQKAELTRELNRMLRDLLSLSRSQEETARHAAERAPNADPSDLALEQARILSGAGRLADRLLEASRKTFFITPQTGAALGRALQKMDETAGNLQSGNTSRASQSAQDAMGALNATALAVRRAIGEMQAAGSAVGFDEMLQKMEAMSQQQGDLNGQGESLFSQQKPGGSTPGQQQSLAQMAARQRAIQQALQELRQQLGAQQQKMLGDLGDIASEMEEAARSLQNQDLDRPLLNRQQKILSRMLDAQHSMRERGRSEEREARLSSGRPGRNPKPVAAAPPASPQ